MAVLLGQSTITPSQCDVILRVPQNILRLDQASMFFPADDPRHLVVSSAAIEQLKKGGIKALLNDPVRKYILTNLISPMSGNRLVTSFALGQIREMGVGALIAIQNAGLFIPLSGLEVPQFFGPFDVSVVSDPSVQRKMPTVDRTNSIVLLAMKDQGKENFGKLAAIFPHQPIISDI